MSKICIGDYYLINKNINLISSSTIIQITSISEDNLFIFYKIIKPKKLPENRKYFLLTKTFLNISVKLDGNISGLLYA